MAAHARGFVVGNSPPVTSKLIEHDPKATPVDHFDPSVLSIGRSARGGGRPGMLSSQGLAARGGDRGAKDSAIPMWLM
jgi:hypothetical protein